MKFNVSPYPRNITAAAMVAGTLLISGCTSGGAESPQSGSSAAASEEQKSPELQAAEENLVASARAVAEKIIEDLADPDSLAEPVEDFAVGNALAQLEQHGDISPFPISEARYYRRALFVNTERVINPGTPSNETHRMGISVAFLMPDIQVKADEKLQNQEQLVLADFQQIINQPLEFYSAILTEESKDGIRLTSIEKNRFEVYGYSESLDNASTEIGDATANQMKEMAQLLESREDYLRSPLYYQ
jgi:hypothetical protein